MTGASHDFSFEIENEAVELRECEGRGREERFGASEFQARMNVGDRLL